MTEKSRFQKAMEFLEGVADAVNQERQARERENLLAAVLEQVRELEEEADWEWDYGSKLKAMGLRLKAASLREQARKL